MTFASREDAGRKLGRHLLEKNVVTDLVLGLPRGGVIVGAEVAKILQRPLDVVVVRKIGHPRFREFAVGALAEADTVVLDRSVVEKSRVDPRELDEIIAEETERLHNYLAKFARPDRPDPRGKAVIIVDDGLATGSTLEAAVLSVKEQRAENVTVAVPVASTNGVERLKKICDELVALSIDPDFEAVGQYYASFAQTTDEEVREILAMQ